MAKPKPRRGGRPKTKKAKPGARMHLGLRVSPELKRKLEDAAKQNTRSLSQEVELRLEFSFATKALLDDLQVHFKDMDEIFAEQKRDMDRREKTEAAFGRLSIDLGLMTNENKRAERIADFRRQAELPDLPIKTIKQLMARGLGPESFVWIVDLDEANEILKPRE